MSLHRLLDSLSPQEGPLWRGHLLWSGLFPLCLIAALCFWRSGATLRDAPSTLLKGHREWVHALAFSPDGKTLVSGGGQDYRSGEVKLWDVPTGLEWATLRGHTASVEAVAFAPNGRMLATASFDRLVKLWDVAPPGDPRRAIDSITGYDGAARLWDTGTAKERLTLRGHTGPILCVTFSPCGNYVATAGYDGEVRLWATYDGRCVSVLQGHTSMVHSLAFSPSGVTLASGGSRPDHTGEVLLWDLTKCEVRRKLNGHDGPVLALAFDPEGRRLATASFDHTVKLWDVHGVLRTLQGHTGEVIALAFSRDGKTLVSGSQDQTVKVWDVETGQERHTLHEHLGPVVSVAYAPDGQLLATGHKHRAIRLWGTGEWH